MNGTSSKTVMGKITSERVYRIFSGISYLYLVRPGQRGTDSFSFSQDWTRMPKFVISCTLALENIAVLRIPILNNNLSLLPCDKLWLLHFERNRDSRVESKITSVFDVTVEN